MLRMLILVFEDGGPSLNPLVSPLIVPVTTSSNVLDNIM